MLASLLTCIDLNFRNVKDLPYFPTRRCRNNTEPFDDTLIAKAIIRKAGAQTTIISTLPMISIMRLVTEIRRVAFSRRDKSGYSVGSLGRCGTSWSQVSGKKWNEMPTLLNCSKVRVP